MHFFKNCFPLLLFITLIPFQGIAKTDIEFLLDLSGSMRKVVAAESQIDSARKALVAALQGLPAGTQVALRVYGHRVDQNQKEESCKDSELIVPFGALNVEQIQTAITPLSPKGYTPIAYSLIQARSDFAAEREADRVIILLSDGEETCGGDPVAILQELQTQGFQVVVHTIGFNVDLQTRAQLEGIAKVSGGQYFDAQGAPALAKALTEATQQSLVIEKEKKTYGQEIRGGDSYETAVPLQYDIEYRLDHHQKLGYLDYFHVDLEPGRELSVELHTLEKGINLRGETPKETAMPYAGLQLHGANRNKIKEIRIIGTPHGVKTLSYNPSEAERYYLLIGSTYDDMNKDHVTFKLTQVARGDLGSDRDAGASLNQAMPMQARRYDTNYIGAGDEKDVFSFEARAGEAFFIGIIPNADSGTYFRMAVYDNYKQKVLSQNSGINEGLKSKPFTIPSDGNYFIQLDLGTTVNTPLPYTLELKQPGAPEVAPAPAPSAPTLQTPAPTTAPSTQGPPSPAPQPSPSLSGPGPQARPSPTIIPDTAPQQ